MTEILTWNNSREHFYEVHGRKKCLFNKINYLKPKALC